MTETSRLPGVERSTVKRRIRGLQARRGYSLLLKKGAQYTPLAEAQPILAAARRLESAMNPAASPAQGGTLAGNVAVTTIGPVWMSGVSVMINAFQERRPALRIDLAVTTRRLRLDRLEPVVAIRPSDAPHATGLWLLTRPDMRNNPKVRAFLDFSGKRLSKEKKHFAG